MKRVENGDVKLLKLEMTNKNISAGVNILDQVQGFDVFEDMTKPTMYALFFMTDSIGLFTSFPIIGEETITVEYGTPGLKPTRQQFRCFEVANIVRSENGKLMHYMLKCVSEEHLNNGTNVVAHSFNQALSSTVSDLLTTFLKTKKKLIVDDTKGTQNIVFPRMAPLVAIDMCRRRAVSISYASSSYVFFENQQGFNFKTVEGLIDDGKKSIGSRVFNFNESPTSDKESQFLSNRTVLSFENITSVDTVRNLNDGMHYAVADVFDIKQKKFSTTTFKLKDAFGKFQKTNDKDKNVNTDAFVSEFASTSPRRFFIPKDTSRPDQFIEDMLPVRNSYVMLLNQNVTRILIHGDSGLKAGDVIRLEAPEATGTTGKKKQDEVLTGNYMITRLRHMVTNSTVPKHEVVFDCVRVGAAT
jgi:hypothetical protein